MLERIILGDDHLEYARKVMPFIPNAEVEFVDDPGMLIDRVSSADYSIIVSDNDYGPGKMKGIDLFSYLKEHNIAGSARKILWTGDAGLAEVKIAAKELGIELLDKPEIGALVGLTVSKSPLKQGGRVLVYHSNPNDPVYKTVEKVLDVLLPGMADMGSDLKAELAKDEYGLVIDLSTLNSRSGNGTVAHDMKYLQLDSVPRVACVHDVTTAVTDIARLVTNFYHF